MSSFEAKLDASDSETQLKINKLVLNRFKELEKRLDEAEARIAQIEEVGE